MIDLPPTQPVIESVRIETVEKESFDAGHRKAIEQIERLCREDGAFAIESERVRLEFVCQVRNLMNI